MFSAQTIVAGRYRLLHQLGAGGMGRVWLARDEMLARDVAVKEVVPPPGLSEAEQHETQLRTMREARTAARLNHPNVVKIYDVVHTEDQPWIVMEYVPSRSLHEVITEDGPVTPEQAARIGLAVLAALTAAHQAGVLHRDVKPGNVLLAADGRVVLTDFGLATFDGGEGALTLPGMVYGSVRFVPPERARDGTSLPESDLWSLGATLYAAVEGRSPYARSSAMATLTALATALPDPPHNAGALKPVLAGLLRRNPRDRLRPDDIRRMLQKVATAEPGRARGRRPWRFGRRTPATPAAAGAPSGLAAQPAASAQEQPPDERSRNGNGTRYGTPTREGRPNDERSLEEFHRRAADPRPLDPRSADPRSAAPRPVLPPNRPPIPTAGVVVGEAPFPLVVTPPKVTPPGVTREDENSSAGAGNAPGRDAGGNSDGLDRRAGVDRRQPGDGGEPAAPTRWDRRRWPMAVGRLILVLALIGALTVALVTRDRQPAGPAAVAKAGPTGAGSIQPDPVLRDDGCPTTNPTTFSSTPPQAGWYALVPGWVWYTDPTGFRIAAPQGWQVYRGANGLCFREPGPVGRVLGVMRWPAAENGEQPQQHVTGREQTMKQGDIKNYQRVRLGSAIYYKSAADLEFTFSDANGVAMHADTRDFTVATGAGYTIVWCTKSFDWGTNQALLSMVFASFAP
jgi:serine/threonine protein kinase